TDHVAMIGRRAPVRADSRKNPLRQFENGYGIIVDRRRDGPALLILTLGEDRVDLAPNGLRRSEKVGQLADQIDAEIGQTPPVSLSGVEEPWRMFGAAMRQHGIGHADPADGAGINEALGLF